MFVGFDVKGTHDVKFADPRKTAKIYTLAGAFLTKEDELDKDERTVYTEDIRELLAMSAEPQASCHQADSIARSWHAANYLGPPSAELWSFKLMCLLADFLVAFFAFTMAIRLANHVLFMINVPRELREANEALAPEAVARRLNRAGYMIAVGIRSLFVAVPLVFWLFGPVFLVIATIGLLVALFRLDRNQVIV